MSANNIIKRPLPKERSYAASGIVKRDIIDAKAEAERLIAEAEAQAAAIREEIETRAREAREAAYQQGFEAALDELNEHLLAARERRDAALAGVERDILRLSVKIAEKIIGREIERDDATIAEMVATALRHARQNEALTVRINPADAATIEKFRERLDPGGRVRFVDFVADARVKAAGCLIVTESGTIDAQLETQLRVLERALLAHAGGDPR